MDTASKQKAETDSQGLSTDARRGESVLAQNRSMPVRKKRLIDYISDRKRVTYHHEVLINLARNHEPFLNQMNLMKKLPVHDGCVNTICWNKTGEYILSGSDDCNLCITKPTYLFDDSKDYAVLHKVQTRHLGNIFSAQFLPNSGDYLIVSCSNEGPVIVHDINSRDPTRGVFNFNCHSSTIHGVVTLSDDDKVFLTYSEDKTVRLFDLRCHKSCARASTCPHPALIRNSYPLTTLCAHPQNSNLLLVGRADGLGLVYDRRKLPDPTKFSREKAHSEYLASLADGLAIKSTAFEFRHPLEGVVTQFNVQDMAEKCRFTSLCYSANGKQVLASYSQDYIYLFDHDASSNLELVQTLSKTSTTCPGEDQSSDQKESPQNDRGRSKRSKKPKIRVRGDWSDTGVNSVPHSSRGVEEAANEHVPNFLQRLSEVAFRLRDGRGQSRFVPLTEIIAGPFELNSSNSYNIDTNEENPNNGDDSVRDGGDSQPTNNRRDTSEGYGNRAVNDDESIDDDEFDDNDGGTGELELEICHRDEEEDDDGEEEEEDSDEDDGWPGEYLDEETGRESKSDNFRHRVSSETKMKFKNTFASLKSKYSKIPTYTPTAVYLGHRNCRTSFKEAIFWGDDYIMSGSDDGRIMVWEKDTAKLIMAFPADERVVNRLAPNPNHYALASSGIDYDIKLWSTQSLLDSPLKISQREMDEIVSNNELMLQEAQDTITVPPQLFFRVLATLAHNHLS